MVNTSSTMMPLGTAAPDFALTDVTSGKQVSLNAFEGKRGLVVMFMSRHCPFVKHVQEKVAEVSNSYLDKGVGVVAICSNDVERYPDDGPENMRLQAEEVGFHFPYLFDETQQVAMAYGAACTPDFFLFGGDLELAYRGQFDASRPSNDVRVSGEDLRSAIEALLAGKQVDPDQAPSMGCNIKWKPGNEPAYFVS